MTQNDIEKTPATDVKTTQSAAPCEPQVVSPKARLRIRTGIKAGGSNDQ